MVRGQAISEGTSATMRQLLQNVVTDGGGRNAYIEGYRVGGKTGTAQVYVDGAISADKHIGSFLGFAPMDDPQIAVLFIVDEADVPVDYGSTTARALRARRAGTVAHLPRRRPGDGRRAA